jgi:hypothetical protein
MTEVIYDGVQGYDRVEEQPGQIQISGFGRGRRILLQCLTAQKVLGAVVEPDVLKKLAPRVKRSVEYSHRTTFELLTCLR